MPQDQAGKRDWTPLAAGLFLARRHPFLAIRDRPGMRPIREYTRAYGDRNKPETIGC